MERTTSKVRRNTRASTPPVTDGNGTAGHVLSAEEIADVAEAADFRVALVLAVLDAAGGDRGLTLDSDAQQGLAHILMDVRDRLGAIRNAVDAEAGQ